MKRTVLCALALVLGLSLVPAWGAEGTQKLGVGGSFNLALGTPILDVFYETPMGTNSATRFTLGLWAFAQGALAFSLDASFLLQPQVEGFRPYFGGGVGGIAVAAGGIGGVAQINLTVNGVGGTYFALSEAFGLYAQVRLIGVVNLVNFQITALLMPGAGLYVTF
ncbi:MAG: hypothetical protein N2320_00810 [Candidatus Bipolaricaulota bacterium]|nr:hypothetical protein [Candidatus Bipolaricaulota bacterium]